MSKKFLKVSVYMSGCILGILIILIGSYKKLDTPFNINASNILEIVESNYKDGTANVKIKNISKYPVLLNRVILNIPNSLDTEVIKGGIFSDTVIGEDYSVDYNMGFHIDGSEYLLSPRISEGDEFTFSFKISKDFERYVEFDEKFILGFECNVFKVKSGEALRLSKGKFERELPFDMGV